jgi:GDP-L-fucose synthase
MNNVTNASIINIGSGKDVSIKELAFMVKSIVGFEGDIIWDDAKPDGTPRKLMDVSRLNNLGWHYKTELQDGIQLAYQDFKKTLN